MEIEQNNNIINIGNYFSRDFVFLTNNGTYSIVLALLSASLPPKSNVIIPSICCPAVLSAVQIANLKPVIADVSKETFCMGITDIEQVYDESCSAIIAVHSFGRPCNIADIEEFCKKKGVFLIEDACLAYGETLNAQKLGSFGDISILSFGYDKPLDCGGGGAILTNKRSLSKTLENFIKKNPLFRISYKSNKTLMDRFGKLDNLVKIRVNNVKKYLRGIKSKRLILPTNEYAFWRLPLIIENQRDQFLEKAEQKGLIFTTHYKSLSSFSTNSITPVADYLDSVLINLFTRPETGSEVISNTIEFINEFYND